MSGNRSTLSEIVVNLLSIIFIVIGVNIALPSAKNLYYIQTSRNWPQVTGQVLSSDVERRWASRGDNDIGQDYFARVWFSYYVNDRSYVSDQVQFAQPWTRSLKTAEILAAKYPAGKPVTVYYHPGDPETSVLDMAVVPPMECVHFGIGILLALAGTVAFITTVLKDLFDDPTGTA
jgi:hypothetical protein